MKKAIIQTSMKNTPALSVNYAIILSQLVEKWGCDANDLLVSSGISKKELENPDNYINSSQYYALIKNAILATGEPGLGLYYGQRLNMSTHGLLGYAILSSPSLAKTAEITNKYIKIAHRLIKPNFHFKHNNTISDREASISIEGHFNDPEIYRFEIESSFTAIYSIWIDLLGSHNGLSNISFKFPPPVYAETYKQFFAIPIQFSCPQNEICFFQQALKPLERLSNPTIGITAEKQCALLLQKLETETEHQSSLQYQLQQLLIQLPGDFLKQEQIAKHLNMTPRTLARKLEKENTSYQKIIDGVKRDLALQCLTFTELTVDEIAYILNYNDASNFTRAFKKWTGLSPSQYKCKKR